jgi:glutaredoxin 3
MIIVYSKPNCPQCDIAKNILKNSSLDYTEIVLGEGISREDFISSFPTVRQMPLIVEDGYQIGGVVELRKYLQS